MSIFKRLRNIIRASVEHSAPSNKRLVDECLESDHFENPAHTFAGRYDFKADQKTKGRVQSDEAPEAAKYYANLELPYGANFPSIKKKYRDLMRLYHPDIQGDDPDKRKTAEQITVQLNHAYEYFKKNRPS